MKQEVGLHQYFRAELYPPVCLRDLAHVISDVRAVPAAIRGNIASSAVLDEVGIAFILLEAAYRDVSSVDAGEIVDYNVSRARLEADAVVAAFDVIVLDRDVVAIDRVVAGGVAQVARVGLIVI